MKTIETILTLSRETKGTFVFEAEADDSGQPPAIKSQYIQKWAVGTEAPQKIKLTVEAVQ